MAATKYLGQKNVFLALWIAIIFAFGMVIFAYSNILLRQECPPKEDAPIEIANNTTNNQVQHGTHHRFEHIIVPDHCGSPLRGLEFDKIYTYGKWSKGKSLRRPDEFYSDADWPPNDIQKISASGPGSDRGYATVTSLKIVKETIAKFKVRSMIDIPCGDVNWIFDSFETDTLPLYVGLDISFGVIGANQQRFGHHRNKHFLFWDATACALPKFRIGEGEEQSVDLVHVRDVIQHMTLDQGVRYFCNVFKSGAKVLITTTFEDGVNRNIREGGFYESNLMAEPFSFPRWDCVATHPTHEKDLTCVYNLTEGWLQEFTSSKC